MATRTSGSEGGGGQTAARERDTAARLRPYSTYFEAEPDSAGEGETEHAPFQALGYSKDHRPDLPQVVIGLAVTREGIPVRVWVWPGNTNDQTVIGQVKDDLRGWRLGRCVWVVDRGFSTEENLRYLTRGGGHWIAGERMRDRSADAQAALARPGRYQTVRDNLRVKDVRLGEGDTARRFVVCHNPVEAERDSAERNQRIARLEAELGRIEPGARRRRARRGRRTHAPSARSATTRPSATTCARRRAAGC